MINPDAAMRALLDGMRPYDKTTQSGITNIKMVKRSADDVEPSLVMIDLSEGKQLKSRLFIGGTMQNQAAIKLEAFSHKLQLPGNWGDKVDTSSEVILSLATGPTPAAVLRRFATCVSERKELGPALPLLKLYRNIDLALPGIYDFLQLHNKARAIAWETRSYKQLAIRMKPDRAETREGDNIYIWDNKEFK